MLHVVPAPLAKELTRYVENGGHLVTTYFSGIVDENDHIWLGGYPGALRELLGIRIEEFGPLLGTDTVEVGVSGGATGTVWTDRITVTDPAVEVLAHYRSGTYADRPAVTRRTVGQGSAAYISTRLGADGLTGLLPELLAPAGVGSELPDAARGSVELIVRHGDGSRYLFLVNRTDETVALPGIAGEPLVGRTDDEGTVVLSPRDVAVLRQPAP